MNMKSLRNIIFCFTIIALIANTGCKLNKTQKGAAVGTAAGGAIGAVVGRASGNTALGAIIGATVGGVTGAVIGHKMDKQAEEIKNTIPDVKVERVGEGIIVEFNDKVLFGFDKSDLSASSKTSLDKLVLVLGKYPDTNIEIQGHTDDVGSDSYNMDLSNRRAGSVSSYIIIKGVAPGRVTTKGYGETAPKYVNNSEENRSMNRRVEFLISANEKMKAEAKQEAEKK
jgi:outer membrane protein OmpA-like peptidoglycan-associated protein